LVRQPAAGRLNVGLNVNANKTIPNSVLLEIWRKNQDTDDIYRYLLAEFSRHINTAGNSRVSSLISLITNAVFVFNYLSIPLTTEIALRCMAFIAGAQNYQPVPHVSIARVT